MASVLKAVPENVAGEFFVDSTCIDCDTCRQLAPHVYGEASDYSFVQEQPRSSSDRQAALHALLACPTGSIGTRGPSDAKTVAGDFPLLIEGDVYYCGFTSPKSFGGSSYFVRHPDGNWLVDSPKFLPQLVRRLESLGGLKYVFLTHRDDVADAAKYARHFAAQRTIHRDELASQPDAEIVLEGSEPEVLASGIKAIPTPGHTRGHMVLLVRDHYLFTGDHLAWDRERQQLTAYRDYCWHSWSEQRQSIARLLEFSFEWVLPGHGQRVQLPADRMRRELSALVDWMTL
jgi:glyoxylase-like metal-dependent hydrolase (beta-lactamase superfamily II)/ferredoxin